MSTSPENTAREPEPLTANRWKAFHSLVRDTRKSQRDYRRTMDSALRRVSEQLQDLLDGEIGRIGADLAAAEAAAEKGNACLDALAGIVAPPAMDPRGIVEDLARVRLGATFDQAELITLIARARAVVKYRATDADQVEPAATSAALLESSPSCPRCGALMHRRRPDAELWECSVCGWLTEQPPAVAIAPAGRQVIIPGPDDGKGGAA